MFRNSQLFIMMTQDLPNITFQKRMSYRTYTKEVLSLFKLINKEIFGNRLPIPSIQVQSNCRNYWGMCTAKYLSLNMDENESQCIIKLSDKWYCKQWLITTLAHEMCHQYQWDVLGHKRVREGKKPIMSHGPSFFIHRSKLMKHGIPLKKALGAGPWFTHQNLFKC